MFDQFSLDDETREDELSAMLREAGIDQSAPSPVPQPSEMTIAPMANPQPTPDPEPIEAPIRTGAALPDEKPREMPAAPQPIVSRQPAPQQPAPDSVPLQQLAQSRQPTQRIPDPPMVKAREDSGGNGAQVMIAMALDALLNKGKNAGALIGIGAMGDQQPQQQDAAEYENWKRKADAIKGNAALEELARRGQPQELSPTQLAAQERMERTKRLWDVNSAESERARQAYVKAGGDPEVVAGRSFAEMDGDPAIRATIQRATNATNRDAAMEDDAEKRRREMRIFYEKMKAEGGEHDRRFAAEQTAKMDAEDRAAGRTAEIADAESVIPGYTKSPSSKLRLSSTELKELRSFTSAARGFDRAVASVKTYLDKATPGEWAAWKVGQYDAAPNITRAKAAHAEAMTQRRVMQNLGTPQAAELKMVMTDLPDPSEWSAGMKDTSIYTNIRAAGQEVLDAKMSGYDYVPEGAARVDAESAPPNLGVTDGAGPKADKATGRKSKPGPKGGSTFTDKSGVKYVKDNQGRYWVIEPGKKPRLAK